MKAIGASLPFVILLVGVLGLVGLSSLKTDPPQKPPESTETLVEITPVVPCETGFTISVDGQVIPYREISLAAEAGGRISWKSDNARAGSYVRKDDPLFEVDPRDYKLEVRRLQETVKQAGSSIEELDVEESNANELITLAEEQLALQRNELKRFENLKNRNAASTSQLERARQSELQSLNSLQTLKNQVTMIGARRNRLLQEKERAITNLDLAELNLQRTKLVSPIDGVVIQDLAEQDDFVQKGTSLIQLEDTSKVEVRFSLRMDQLRWLWNSPGPESTEDAPTSYTYELPQKSVLVRVDLDGNEFSWPATISRYDGAGINAGTRTVPVIAVVEDPQAVELTRKSDLVRMAAPPTLLRGSYVTVDIPVGDDMNLVAIPNSSFQPDKTVWIYDAASEPDRGTLRIEPVRVAYSDSEKVIAIADPEKLSVNDSVVVSPLPVAESGMALRLNATNQPAAAENMTAREDGTNAR